MLKPPRAAGSKLQGAHPGGSDAGSVVNIMAELLAVRRRLSALVREREVEARPVTPPVEPVQALRETKRTGP